MRRTPGEGGAKSFTTPGGGNRTRDLCTACHNSNRGCRGEIPLVSWVQAQSPRTGARAAAPAARRSLFRASRRRPSSSRHQGTQSWTRLNDPPNCRAGHSPSGSQPRRPADTPPNKSHAGVPRLKPPGADDCNFDTWPLISPLVKKIPGDCVNGKGRPARFPLPEALGILPPFPRHCAPRVAAAMQFWVVS
jgi:hypothetical protein